MQRVWIEGLPFLVTQWLLVLIPDVCLKYQICLPVNRLCQVHSYLLGIQVKSALGHIDRICGECL